MYTQYVQCMRAMYLKFLIKRRDSVFTKLVVNQNGVFIRSAEIVDIVRASKTLACKPQHGRHE
jgi:hypothetical protein